MSHSSISSSDLQALQTTIDSSYFQSVSQFISCNAADYMHSNSVLLIPQDQSAPNHILSFLKTNNVIGLTNYGQIVVKISANKWIGVKESDYKDAQEQIQRNIIVGNKEVIIAVQQKVYISKVYEQNLHFSIYSENKNQNSWQNLQERIFIGVLISPKDKIQNIQLVSSQEKQIFNRNKPPLLKPQLFPVFSIHNGLCYLSGFHHENKTVFLLDLHIREILNNELHQVDGILNLGSENIGSGGLELILAKSIRIHTLNLWWNMIGEKGAKILSNGFFPLLSILDLRKNYIGDAGLKHFTTSLKPNFPNLKNFILSDNNIKNIVEISQNGFPNIRQLDLQNNKIDLISSHIFMIKTLHILALRNNNINGLSLGVLHFENLRVLHLSNNNIISCQSMRDSFLPMLRTLCLDKNKITTLKWMKKCSFCIPSRIQFLDLSDNHINEINDLYLIDWREIKQLKLNNNGIKKSLIKSNQNINDLRCLMKWRVKSQTNRSLRITHNLKDYEGDFCSDIHIFEFRILQQFRRTIYPSQLIL